MPQFSADVNKTVFTVKKKIKQFSVTAMVGFFHLDVLRDLSIYKQARMGVISWLNAFCHPQLLVPSAFSAAMLVFL